MSPLTRQAAEWATAILHSDSDIAHSYPEFTHQLSLALVHSKFKTGVHLHHLRQGTKSVSRFAA